MAIDDFMFHVAKFWYRTYWGIIVLLNTVVLAGYLLVHFVPQPHLASLGHTLNLDNGVTPILSILVLVYILGPYWLVQRLGAALATLIASMLNAFVLLNGITNTGSNWGGMLYLVLWALAALLSGMYGVPGLMGSVLLSGVFVLAQSNFRLEAVNQQSWIMLGSTMVITIIAYFFWRNRFISQQDKQMSKLSGMLRTNQTQSAILIQSIADGVIVTNTEGQITLMNRAASNMTGWTTEEAAGTEVKLVVKVRRDDGSEIPEEEYPFTAVLTHKAFINSTLQITSRHDKKQVISLVISPVVTASGEVYGAVAVMRDVSEQRAAEKQSAEFISTASHEMRTPVAAIEGYLALALNDKVSTIDARARSFLEKAHASTQHLGELFQDLLTSAKAEDGRLTNHPQIIEIGAFMEQLVEDLRFSAQKKGLAAEFVVGSDAAIDATKSDEDGRKVVKPLYYVNADPDRLREVITNLFDNACKYTDAGKISIGLTGNTEVVQAYIRDTGAGIPAEDIPHLFQKFYRVDSSATRTIGGTGLGLFICRKIIEMYQGRLWVESEMGKGSTFFINLPRIDSLRAQQMQSAAAATPPQ
ncbi:MAG TPA: ATP-binding protein [Patescibacteria group bacterium]|nr:ATP-binding protein [Patescibacteria group bacterium]